MDTSQWTSEMKQLHLEIEAEAEKLRRIAILYQIKRAVILMSIIATGLVGYFNESYLTSNFFEVDLKSCFIKYFSQDISDTLAEVFDFVITTTCAICMLYTLYWIGFFHWLGSGNRNYRHSHHPNISRVVDYRNGLMAAKSPDAALELLTKTAGIDAIASGQFNGTNIARTVGYLDGLMGANDSENALKIFTGKNR